MQSSAAHVRRHPHDPVLETILRRRSVRFGFTDRAPDGDVIRRIVVAGLSGPSSKNARPWRLHVVTDKGLLSRIASIVKEADGIDSYVPIDPTTGEPYEKYESTVVESAEVVESAPLSIFIENLGEFSKGREAVASADPETIRRSLVGFTLEAIGLGAAIQNIWLAAIEQGLQGVFMGDILISDSAIEEMLGMNGDLVGVVSLGYSSADLPARGFDPAGDDVVWH